MPETVLQFQCRSRRKVWQEENYSCLLDLRQDGFELLKGRMALPNSFPKKLIHFVKLPHRHPRFATIARYSIMSTVILDIRVIQGMVHVS